MYHIVLCFAAALVCSSCRAASVNKHLKLLPELENSIEGNGLPTKHSPARRFLSLTKRPHATHAHAPGALLTLTCEALGAPAPSVRWFKNDAPVYEHDTESIEQIDINPTSLARVSSTLLVTRTEDTDEYTCLASSGKKVVRASTIVYSTAGVTPDKTERSKLQPFAPRILVTYKAFVDTIGNSIVLPCKAKGHPRPRVTWKDNNGTFVTRDTKRMKVLRSGELVISSLLWSDMGEWTCQAANIFGTKTASTFLYPALVSRMKQPATEIQSSVNT
ncbi:neural/ectodermal development factor IMP-L2-like isoform X1 [Ostrinia nubilalis]|uniref:neural/ectodermal development factor IMP-L2-like isoform X1 n=1 Tax=Ostrinia nubilalis TaxID=29057 RepID=UPI0030824337